MHGYPLHASRDSSEVLAVDVMEEVVSDGEDAAELQDSGSKRRKKQRGDKRKR